MPGDGLASGVEAGSPVGHDAMAPTTMAAAPVDAAHADPPPDGRGLAGAHVDVRDPRGPRSAGNGADREAAVAGCTAPQLRRFVKSRPYVPMHELRRRFGINGHDDDVTAVDLSQGRVYVGLPAREGALLGELLRGGDIGYELSLDPRSPIVIGLYPMRPVGRS